MVLVSTDTYIQQFNAQHHSFSPLLWMHDNPTTLKVMQVAGVVLGAVAFAALPLTAAITVATVTIGAALGSWLCQKYLTSSHHPMTEHAYQEGSCEAGRLYYRGDLPILELNTQEPVKAGEAHGYLLGSAIHELKSHLDLVRHTVLREPRACELRDILNEVREKIPQEYIDEMEGVANGYNRWAQEAGKTARLTLDDVVLMHLIPDSKHFHPKQVKSHQNELLGAMACTSLLQRGTSDEGVIFGRNMDWIPFGDGGGKSLLIVWKPENVAALGVPGMIGVITGWNQKRLTLAMNVSPGETTEVRGLPAILYNRLVLSEASTVAEAKNLMERVRPLGPYHMTIADAEEEAAAISFYQDADGKDFTRSLEDDQYLPVLNWCYPACEGGYFNSSGRDKLLNQYMKGAKERVDHIEGRKLINNALAIAPLVNSRITMHSLVMLPKADEVELNWDNGFAASNPRQHLALTEVF